MAKSTISYFFCIVYVLSAIIDRSVAELDLQVVTVATDATDGFRRFNRSVTKYGLDLKVLGMGEKWDGGDIANYAGGGQKINIYKEGLKEFSDRDDLIIMCTDSYDLVFTNGATEILEKFKKFDARVVYSAEGFCWPDRTLMSSYPQVKPKEYRYLNSGGELCYTIVLVLDIFACTNERRGS